MNWIVAKIKWIMLSAGALTCGMLCAAVWPSEAVDFLFDRTLESALARIVVTSWACHVGLVGAMLIHGAFAPQARTLTLTAAGCSKLAFLGLMLANGRQYLDEKVSLVIALDMVMVALFAVYLIGVRRRPARRESVSQTIVSAAPRGDQGARPSASIADPAGPIPARTPTPARATRRPGPTT